MMLNEPSAPKRAVNMTLTTDLVQRARRFTPNLSETVESLLTAFVAQEEARERRLDREIAAYIKASDAFAAKYGSLADEFPTL